MWYQRIMLSGELIISKIMWYLYFKNLADKSTVYDDFIGGKVELFILPLATFKFD